MGTRSRPHWITLLGASLLWLAACDLSAAVPTETARPSEPSPSPTPIVIVVTATQPEVPTLEPTSTSEPTLAPTDTAIPKPRRPKVKSSNEQGDCGTPQGSDGSYGCAVVFSSGMPVQLKMLKDGHEIGKADGVQDVNFEVTQNGNPVYSNDEKNEAYCLFGGNGPCNSWTLEDDVYKWKSGGPTVKAGKYNVHIEAFFDNTVEQLDLNWSATITITLP